MSKKPETALEYAQKTLLDILFPIYCLGCEREGSWLCRSCAEKVKILENQACPQCEKEITPGGKLCSRCRREKKSRLDAMICAVSYKAPATKKLVHIFKYNFVTDAAKILSHFILKAFLSHECPLPSAIIPVPLHQKRLRWRGFNQAALLAENISRTLAPPLQIPILDILERKKCNQPQMEVKNYQERLRNVKDVFRLKSGFDHRAIQGKKLLLIDDIATTGATLEECARVLKENGAKKIFTAVVARQTLKK